MNKRSVRRYAMGLVGVVALAAAWFIVGPQQVGGPVTYVIIAGTSMEPSIKAGDLALVRERDEYGPEDVVAFHSAKLDRTVLHRIVRAEGDRLVTKGDNNDFEDPDRTEQGEVIGELWVRVPAVGRALSWLQQPRNAAVVGGAAALLILGLGGWRFGRRRAHVRRERAPEARPPGVLASRPVREATFAVLAVAAAGFGVLAFLAFRQPVTRIGATEVPYEHTGSFAYSAEAPEGAVYQDGRVETGDPVFVKLVKSVTVAFTYEFASEVPHDVSGTAGMTGVISDQDGWSRTFVVAPPESFRGSLTTVSGELNLVELLSLVERVQRLTGLTRDQYTVNVTPDVEVRGAVAGEEIEETFSAPLTFQLSKLTLGLAAGSDAGDVLRPTAPGSVRLTRTEPNTLSLLGKNLRISTAREVSRIGTGASLLALALVSALFLLTGRRAGEVARIEARYGSRMVPVTRVPAGLSRVVEVADMEALAGIADQYEVLILHAEAGRVHTFFVEHDGILYLYRVDVGEDAVVEVEAPVGERELR